MICNIKLFISFFIISLTFVSFYSKASTCPPVESISRIKGEYAWQTTEPGWMGYFVAPTQGKGRSYKVDKFISATWVKTSDDADSAGFIQCQYSGNFVALATVPNPNYAQELADYQANVDKQAPNSQKPLVPPSKTKEVAMNEVIRFMQVNSNGAAGPMISANSWSCTSIIKFPSEACQCYNGLDKCNFRLA